MAETTDSVSRRNDSVSRLLSLGSDMSLGRGEDRDLQLLGGGTVGRRRRGRWLGTSAIRGGAEGGFATPARWARGASCCWAT